ncbi:lipoyl protein ligase domain-containing protein [Sporomusa sp.]|uniref:lipoyl protein ligase domain-containing protein n=1 Tax=Sporomusa sp. TaxID=2078658 RepID=UPI002BA35B9E|nr:DUF116 domain-containing protein [Sporomusa sp.]HWR05897.1 DUF116 domain-containing protein [Sporomusa sp.]
MRPVRVLDTGSRTGAQNVALAKALLMACNKQLIPDTLRFFQFNSDCVLLGYHQIAEQEVRLSFCYEQGIEVNRRLSGGNTVYCDESTLGWETVVYRAGLATGEQLETLTMQLGAAITRGLNLLGVNAQYKHPGTVEVAGRELCWLGGTRHGNAVLYQGCVRINDVTIERMLYALRIPTEKLKNKEIDLFSKKFTSLKGVLSEPPTLASVKGAIVEGFCEVFHAAATPGRLKDIEDNYYQTAYSETSSQEWVSGQAEVINPGHYQLRDTSKEQAVVTVSIAMDAHQQQIDAVSIAGDFYAYPLELVQELEAGLCGIMANPALIRKTVNDCFRKHQGYVPGLLPDHFSQTIIRAAEKLRFLDWGAYPEELNEITIVGDCIAKDIFEQPVTPLLVPYCAKDIGCKFRYIEGCGRCGKCDISDAYNLADQYGLATITIQNYEMLEEKLENLKKNGCRVFIGACCESFWVKHARDFERIGLPGILVNVDNSTCYDLGKEQKAYQGSFENQTRLKNDLILRILQRLANYSDEALNGIA